MPTIRKNTPPRFQHSPKLPALNSVYQGIVKDNEDTQTMGRLRVWIPEFGSQEEVETGWVTVSYCSPFAGATDIAEVGNNEHVDHNAQTSYGFWMVPPDRGNIVIVMFINGDPSRGIWIGGLYQQNMNQMVPGLAVETPDGQFPTTEYNKRKSDGSPNRKRPVLTEQRNALLKQGLLKDKIRGTTQSSARRESPSQVFGISTPGPQRASQLGTRAGGNQFVMDDKIGEEKIRLRTRRGAQILLDDSNGLVYVINRDGTAWIQMDEDGNVDVFGAASFSVRAKGDINFDADRDINFFAANNISLYADKSFRLTTKEDIHIRSERNVHVDGKIMTWQKGASLKLTVNENDDIEVVDDRGNRTPAKTESIVSRMPTFEPSPIHKDKS